MFGNTGVAASAGPDLETIQTEALGFLPLAGEAKVRLTSPWPAAPPQTASLLSVASRKGLVAAAGPDEIILATTESVRNCFNTAKQGDTEVRSFAPQLKIPAPTRISHLAFTADEEFLILSAESGGGLAVYAVQSLLQGSTSTAFELSTNGESLRLLAPNPTAEKAELCAVITANGNLYMANLKERKLSNALRSQASCLSWSVKGKQLCAGMGNGTIAQMTPEGEGKGEIPQPPVSGGCYVSSLLWLENNLFLAIYTASNEPTSAYHIVSRQTPSTFTFRRLTDPVEAFGIDKAPHNAILRLKDFLDLQDLLIISSTASTEVGVLTRCKSPLALDKPAEAITNVFTTTEFLEDTRRPTLPMTETMDDSVAVGVALDLSSKDKVQKPIPSDEELDQSPGPLPGFWVLTHEGVLCAWWLVYNDAVKKGQTYPGLSVMDGITVSATSTPLQSASANSALTFTAPGASAFGSSTTPSSTTTFGAPSQMGQQASSWATTATPPAAAGGGVPGPGTFGSSPSGQSSTFGKPNALGFGQSSQLGMRTSPWSSAAGSKPAFGQAGFSSFAGSNNSQSPFGSSASNTSAAAPAASGGGAFSAFSSKSGFASLNANGSSPSSGFGSGTKFGAAPFGTTGNASGNSDPSETSIFSNQHEKPGSTFGSAPFKLESSFKPDPSQATGKEHDAGSSGPSMFSSNFASALGDAANEGARSSPATRDEDMDLAESTEDTSRNAPQSVFTAQQAEESTTPTSTPVPPRFGPISTTSGTSLFGQPTKTETPSSGLFGSSNGSSRDIPKSASTTLFGPGTVTDSTSTSGKSQGEQQSSALPPETTSKAALPIGDSLSSSAVSHQSQLVDATSTPERASSIDFSTELTTPKPQFNLTDTTTPSDSARTEKPAAKVRISGDTVEKEPQTSADVSQLPKFAKETTADAGPQQANLTRTEAPSTIEDAPLPPDFVLPRGSTSQAQSVPVLPETAEDESDLGADDVSEGSGVDVAKDLSPSTGGLDATPGYTPHSSFGGLAGTSSTTAGPADGSRSLFGEINRNVPFFPKPGQVSPNSPSPIRGAVPRRLARSDAARSVSAPGMASRILGPRSSHVQPGGSIISSREGQAPTEDSFITQHRRMRERQEAEEIRPLVDEADEEVQRILASDVQGTLELAEFIAHSNVVPPAKDSVPAQVEAVYRDINSMIDTLGLNARTVKAFIKGHKERPAPNGRSKHDLEVPDDWVLCEIDELGEVLDTELHADLEDGRVQDLEAKMEVCQELSRDMQRLRAKQEDLRRAIMASMDPTNQAEYARSLPLSSEQAAQQSELRREYARFTDLLTEAENALIVLKTRIAAVAASGPSSRGSNSVPTVEAVLRTISKMTSMVEKRSGDVDVLETQLRKMKLGSASRENSPMMTPQMRRSMVRQLSPDLTPSRNSRHSLTLSSSITSLGGSSRNTPPRKKLSGFSKEEKGDLMAKRAGRQAVLSKLKENVRKRGVNVWNMEDIE